MNKTSRILVSHFKKLKKSNPRFSLRALAIRIGVSHAFLSKVFKGQARPSVALCQRLIEQLKVDRLDADSILEELRMKREFETAIPRKRIADVPHTDTTDYVNQPTSHLKILRRWWNLAILDLLTCDMGINWTLESIQEVLPLDKRQIQEAVEELKSLDLVRVNNSGLYKVDAKLRLPARIPNEYTRAFYLQTLQLAQQQLKKTDEKSYEARLLLGFTCAANKENIPFAKQKLAAALRECAETLAEGPCNDVFLVQGQMFSLLK